MTQFDKMIDRNCAKGRNCQNLLTKVGIHDIIIKLSEERASERVKKKGVRANILREKKEF